MWLSHTVDVDEAWGDKLALGVDLLGTGAGYRAYSGDLVADQTDIGLLRGSAGAVDHGAAADNQIICWHWTFS